MRSRLVSVAALLLALAAAGCGEQDEPAREPPAGGTELTVTVRPDRSAQPRVEEIECPPHARRATCIRLEETQLENFAAVPPDVACTAIYGGPATATVRGRLRGHPLDAGFTLRNGCEIARWERFAWLIGDAPGTSAA
jgi:hypothetical protein